MISELESNRKPNCRMLQAAASACERDASLVACATAPSRPHVVCPSVAAYDRAFQARLLPHYLMPT